MAKKILGNDPFAKSKPAGRPESSAKAARAKNASLRLLEDEGAEKIAGRTNDPDGDRLQKNLGDALEGVGGVDDQIKRLEEKLQRLTDVYEQRINALLEQAGGEISERPAIDKLVGSLTEFLEKYSRLLRLSTYRDAYRRLSMLVTAEEVDEFGFDQKFEDLVLPLMKFFYNTWWRVQTSGIRNLPDEGRVLLVSNHSGALPYDGAMIKMAIQYNHPTKREVRPLVEDFAFNFPFLGTIIQRIGGVRACQENGQRLLEKEEVVAVFPEGVKGLGKFYNERYQLQRFGRGGFVKLAIRTNSPIVPVAVIGAEEIHPMVGRAPILARAVGVPYFPITPTFPLLGLWGMIPLPSKWYIHFGEPIDMSKYGPDTLEDAITINKISEQIRGAIQEMIYEVLKRRKSVWFG